jgi:hypothetical protein
VRRIEGGQFLALPAGGGIASGLNGLAGCFHECFH